MCAVRLRKPKQARSIEVNASVMDMIWILVRVHSTGLEVDLACGHLYSINASDDPRASRDLVKHLASAAIVSIQMVPAIALRHPHNFIRLAHMFAEVLVFVVDEGLAFLIDNGAGHASVGIHADNAQDLMAPLVVDEQELLGIRLPPYVHDLPRIAEQRVIYNGYLLPCNHIEQMWLALRNSVTWFEFTSRQVMKELFG